MNLSYHSKAVKSNVTIAEEFTLQHAILYGGYNLLSDFLTSVELQQMTCGNLSLKKAHWAMYPLAEVVQGFVGGYISRLQRREEGEHIEATHFWYQADVGRAGGASCGGPQADRRGAAEILLGQVGVRLQFFRYQPGLEGCRHQTISTSIAGRPSCTSRKRRWALESTKFPLGNSLPLRPT